MAQDQTFLVTVSAITREAETIRSYDLRLPAGGPLPAFDPGAHIDVHLDVDLTRSYSLVNSTGAKDRYVIAVDQAPQSRGGSRWLSERIAVGDVLRISPPRNLFPLAHTASHSVLIAGGIGITPLLSMVRHLEVAGRSWELHYCARNAARAAFLSELSRPEMARKVSMHYSDTQGERDFWPIARDAPAGAHFYCCGPAGMLDAFLRATECVDPAHIHIERFSGSESATQGGFELILAKSKKVLQVRRGETVLDRLETEGFEIANSCREGVCGSCEVKLLAGRADHRDMILTDDEKAANTSMFVCCSGSLTQSLTLDL